jgi:hypothetical protein
MQYTIEMTEVTRISDLPENITVQMQQQGQFQQPPYSQQGQSHQSSMQGVGGSLDQTTYVPINIHPNPYGTPQQAPPGGMPFPQSSPQRTGDGQLPMPQQRLPSRDIPMNQFEFQQDEEIQPNYVPKAKLTSDYIREYEAGSENALKKHEQGKHREKMATTLFSELQLPILVAILYFTFQMPVVTSLLRKYFSFLSIYHDDGNLNVTGLIMKSILFGSVFYTSQYFAETVSSW